MALNQSQISALYVSLFGRASEGAGNKAWVSASTLDTGLTLQKVANLMLQTSAAQEFFGKSMDSNEAFVKHIYNTTFNKGDGVDEAGKKGWIEKLNSNQVDRGELVVQILQAALDPVHANATDAATRDAHLKLVNQIITSNVVADSIETLPSTDLKTSMKFFQEINDAIKPDSTIDDIKNTITAKRDAAIKKSLDENSNVKTIAQITGKSEEEIKNELTKSLGGKEHLKSVKDGFTAKITDGNDKYFVNIKIDDNKDLKPELKTTDEISVKSDGSVTRGEQKIKADVFAVKEFPSGDTITDTDTQITKVFTKGGQVFVPAGKLTAKNFAKAAYNKEGFFASDDGIIEGTTDGTKASGIKSLSSDASKAVVKLEKGGETTYYVRESTGDAKALKLELKAGDKIKFEAGFETLEKIAKVEDAKVGKAQYFVDDQGNTKIIIPGDDSTKSDDDLIIDIGKFDLKAGGKGSFDIAPATPPAAGVEKISDGDGFVKLFGDDAPAIKIKNVFDVYKKDGKFYTDKEATKELGIKSADDNSGTLQVASVKLKDGTIFTAKLTAHATIKDPQNKASIIAYTEDKLAELARSGDTLKVGDTIYTFYRGVGEKDKSRVTMIENGDFKFEDSSNSSYGVTYEQAKQINKANFEANKIKDIPDIKDMTDKYNAKGIGEGDTITTGGVTYILKHGGEKSGEVIMDISTAKKMLSDPAKVVTYTDNSITISDKIATTKADLDAIKDQIAKVKEIQSVKVSADEMVTIDDNLIKKIKASSIELTDNNALTADQLKGVAAKATFQIPNGYGGLKTVEALKDGTIKAVDTLTATDFVTIVGGIGNFGKISNKKFAKDSLKVSDTVANLVKDANQAIKNAKKYDAVIDISGDDELVISNNDFSGVKFTAGDKVKITEATGALTGSEANDTFVLKANANFLSANNIAANDKIDFSALGVTKLGKFNATNGTAIENGKIYQANFDGKLGVGYGETWDVFANMFGADKAFSDAVASGVKALVLVKGKGISQDQTNLYLIDNTDATFNASDIKLISSSSFEITADNVLVTP